MCSSKRSSASALEARGASRPDLHERVIAEARTLGVPDALLARGVNTEFSGGEKKRAETVQLAVLEPKFAVLDEIDSGLDVDALRDVARRVYALAKDGQVGVLAITHYARLLAELRPDRVHVFLAGRIVKSGGPELADELERTGYEGIAAELGIDDLTVGRPAEAPTRSVTPPSDRTRSPTRSPRRRVWPFPQSRATSAHCVRNRSNLGGANSGDRTVAQCRRRGYRPRLSSAGGSDATRGGFSRRCVAASLVGRSRRR